MSQGNVVQVWTLEWRGDPPQPYPVCRNVVNKDRWADVKLSTLAMPYRGKRKKDEEGNESPYADFLNEQEEEFDGKTCLEVRERRLAQLAAEGDMEAFKYQEDRILGKPTQHSQNVNLSMTLQQFAAQLHQMDEEEPLRDPPEKMPVAIEVSDTYEIIETDDANILDVRGIADEELLLDPLAGF